jgi:hypothetical protein
MKCHTESCDNVLGPIARKKHKHCSTCRARLAYWDEKTIGQILKRRDNLKKYSATAAVAYSMKRRQSKKKDTRRTTTAEARASV